MNLPDVLFLAAGIVAGIETVASRSFLAAAVGLIALGFFFG